MGDDRGDRPRTNGREYITTRWVLGVAGTLIFLLLTISAGMFHARMAALETANATTQQQTAETDGRVRVLEEGVKTIKERIGEIRDEQREQSREQQRKLDELLRRTK